MSDRVYLTQVLLVGAGGFVGSCLRCRLGGCVQRAFPLSPFPPGTLLANVSAQVVLGLFAAWAGFLGGRWR